MILSESPFKTGALSETWQPLDSKEKREKERDSEKVQGERMMVPSSRQCLDGAPPSTQFTSRAWPGARWYPGYSHAPAAQTTYSHSLAHISSGPSHQPNLPTTTNRKLLDWGNQGALGQRGGPRGKEKMRPSTLRCCCAVRSARNRGELLPPIEANPRPRPVPRIDFFSYFSMSDASISLIFPFFFFFFFFCFS